MVVGLFQVLSLNIPDHKVKRGKEMISNLVLQDTINGIKNIGYEDPRSCYDSKMRYIGKGPIGCYELLSQITAVAKKLQESGFIREQFGKAIPIIIHDLEYPWYMIEATKEANPNGEADTFFFAMKKLGIIGGRL